jgi:hypothetical protein
MINDKSKYVILGAFPPPVGGVSIYCERKYKEIKIGKQYDARRVNTKSLKSLAMFFFDVTSWRLSNQPYLIEINGTNMLFFLLLFFLAKPKNCIYVDHNSSRRVIKKIDKFIFSFFMERIKKIIIVNSQLANNYKSSCKRKIIVKTPFIAPMADEVVKAKLKYSTPMLKLFDESVPVRNLVLCTAWKTVSTIKEKDLYGLLLTLDIYTELLPHFPNIHFIMMLGVVTDDKYGQRVLEVAEHLNKYNNCHLFCGNYSALPFLSKAKLLLRLTKTDGDSISVKEGLFFGCDVLCSDVVTRPVEALTVPLEYKQIINKIKTVIGTTK